MSDQSTENAFSTDWLDDAYVQKILTSFEGEETEVIKYELEAATKKGDNFASSLNRLRVQYCSGITDQVKNASFIVKSRLGGEVLAEIESQFSIYDRESQMYKCILKSCEELLQSIGDETRFGPRAIYVDEQIIILEDLKELNYAMMDVRKGLDLEPCKRVIIKLAKLHATTKVLYDKQPELFKYHIAGNLTEVRTPLHDIYENTMDTCIEYITAKEDLKQFESKLNTFRKDIIKRIIGVFTRSPSGFNVLNHGDMWVNNFMFKKDSTGNIVDVLFVDFQEGFFGSPGIDINYLIYSSFMAEVYQHHREDLIKLYFDILTSTLEKLNMEKLPSLETIHQEIDSKGDHGVVTACCLYPILTTDKPDLADPVAMVMNDDESKDARRKVFDSMNYYKKMKLVLPDFIKEGYL